MACSRRSLLWIFSRVSWPWGWRPICGFYQLVCLSCPGPYAVERKENPEMPLPGAPSSFSAAYSKCLPCPKNTFGTCACPPSASQRKVTRNWPGRVKGWQVCRALGNTYETMVVWACRRPGLEELLSPATFLWVLILKSHNWTPKASVLLVKKTNGSKFCCSPDTSRCSSWPSRLAKKTSLPETGSQIAFLRREQLVGARMRCNHYQFLKQDVKPWTTNADSLSFHKS